jgi:hypothetical protein
VATKLTQSPWFLRVDDNIKAALDDFLAERDLADEGGAVPVDTTIWRVSRWRDGKCTWWGRFRSESDALQAMGLSA